MLRSVRRWEDATFCKLPVRPVNHGKDTVSKTSNILSILDESCFNEISGTAEIIQAEEELIVLTNMVEYSSTSKIVGKDLNLHIANLSMPAATLALEYAVTEVPQNCDKQEVILACTDYPFIFRLQVTVSTLAEDFKKRPEGKRCKIDVTPTVGTSGAMLYNLTSKSLPTNIFSMFRVQFLGENQRGKKEQRRKILLQL